MSLVTRINESIAVAATRVFGSMWTTYTFFAYGFLPVIFPSWMTALLYWSNTVQLWSLPLLLVGSAVLTRGTQTLMERLLRETHDAVMEEMGLLRQVNETVLSELATLRSLVAALNPASAPSQEK
ncbi:hypothetical protein ACIGXM_14490 [Kitasatospora sp. NPDC052896]|uniref:hypothetical protein n=1 Tax=Kitasatospora sp. NPDC052896 TaxID=3364061 RepID=UPI0037CA2D3E